MNYKYKIIYLLFIISMSTVFVSANAQSNRCIDFDKKLQELIDNNNISVSVLQKTNDSLYVLRDLKAEIKGLNLKPNQHSIVKLKFAPNKEFVFQRYVYEVDMHQVDEIQSKSSVVNYLNLNITETSKIIYSY